MRFVENVSGRLRLLPIYHRWRTTIAGKSSRQWAELLDLIDMKLDISAAPGWTQIARDEPLVVIANHPFGIADGIALLALAESLERPYRILLNAEFMRVPEVQACGLPIDFSATERALETNLATRAEARRLLNEGVTIVVFPAGGVATAENPFGDAEELVWKQFTARLVQQSRATVLPVYFPGQNSALFQFISRYSLSARLSLLVSEFGHRVGKPIAVRAGKPIPFAELVASPHALLDALYLAVQRLRPGAEDLPDTILLPRPVAKRRRYPWDGTARTSDAGRTGKARDPRPKRPVASGPGTGPV